MKKIFILLATLASCIHADAWSRRNHMAAAYIAEQHLTPKAYSTVKEILHGESLVYYAGWMDDFRKIELLTLPEADEDGNTEIQRVHYFTVDKKFKPVFTPYKDGLWLIANAVENLADYASLTQEQRLDYMKVLAHLVADIHCPGHISYADKRDHKLAHFSLIDHRGREISGFHKFLDFTALDWKFPGGMTDLAYAVDPTLRPNPSEADLKYMNDVQSGLIVEWGIDCAMRCKDLFEFAKPGHQLSVQEVQWIADLEKDQILRAGYRLAKILNDLFGGR